MSSFARAVLRTATRELKARADPAKAGPMADYMKTADPFYGVQKPLRKEVFKILVQDHPIETFDQYESTVRLLFGKPHRELRYLALDLAQRYRDHHTLTAFPLFEDLVRQGAWWDLVDPVAAHLIGSVWLEERSATAPKMDRFIDDEDLWIRRTAIIGQLKHKAATDHRRLFRYCQSRASEKEFFIRKAIGWALREYSWTEPDRVYRFLCEKRSKLSGLSFREGSRHLKKEGYEF